MDTPTVNYMGQANVRQPTLTELALLLAPGAFFVVLRPHHVRVHGMHEVTYKSIHEEAKNNLWLRVVDGFVDPTTGLSWANLGGYPHDCKLVPVRLKYEVEEIR